MTAVLSSRFSDSTIASASSSFSRLSSASSVSSVEDLLLPSLDAIPKPPPRTSSITINSTKTYSERRERKKPAPLQLVSSSRPMRYTAASTNSISDDGYYSCKEDLRRSGTRAACFCGADVRPSTSSTTSSSTEIYCSRKCARQDALYALEGRSPTMSYLSASSSDIEEEDEDFPVTPTNAFVPATPRAPIAKGRTLELRDRPSLMKKMTGIGASHYRRMEALGLYDADSTPTRPSTSNPLMDPIDLMVAHSPKSKSVSSLASSSDDEDFDFDPRKTLFFPVPIYMGASTQP